MGTLRLTGADLTDRFRDQAAKQPEVPLIIEGGRPFTGAEVLRTLERKISGYGAAGLGAHSRVGVLAWPPMEFVTDAFAILALGGVVAPLGRNTTEWEVRRADELACLTGTLTSLETPLPLAGEEPGTRIGERRLTSCRSHRSVDNAGASAAQLTSGTTGSQKVAMRPASALLSEADHYRDSLRLGPGDTIASALPLHHAYGLGLCALAAPLAGATVAYVSANRPRVLLRELADSGASLFPSVPPALRVLAGVARAQAPKRGIAYVTAGMAIDARTAELVATVLGGQLGEVYGTTETGPICIRPPSEWDGRVPSLGPPLSTVDVALAPLPSDEVAAAERIQAPSAGAGIVTVRSPSMLLGYWNAGGPEGAEGIEDFKNVGGRFVTGDIGRWADDGLVVVGRVSTCINSGGMKISPEEIEMIVLGFEPVATALAVAVDDALLGQRVKVMVTPDSVDVDALRRFCEARLSPPMMPAVIEAVAELRTTASGKVIRPGAPSAR